MLPESGAIDGIFDATRWWLESFGGFAEFDASNAVLTPTEADFPVDVSLRGHALAQDYFAFVQEHARLREWKFQLVMDQTPSVADAMAGMTVFVTSLAKKILDEALTLPEDDRRHLAGSWTACAARIGGDREVIAIAHASPRLLAGTAQVAANGAVFSR